MLSLFPRLPALCCALWFFLSSPLFGQSTALPDTDSVVVTVNATPILESQVIAEVDHRINQQTERDRAKGLIFEESARSHMRGYLRDAVLHTLIERILIQQQLDADHIEIPTSEIDARLQASSRPPFSSPDLDYIRLQILGVEKLYALHAVTKNTLSEAEALRLYREFPAEYDLPETRRVSHLLIAFAPNAGPMVKTATRARAQALLDRLKAGEDFAALARRHSDDARTQSLGGDCGYSDRGYSFRPGDAPFTEAAFALKKIGDITEIVEDDDGFHLIQLTGLRPARRQTFEEVKPRLIADFRHREIGDFWEKFAANLHARAQLQWSENETNRRAQHAAQAQEQTRQIDAKIAAQKNADAAKGTP